MRSQHLSPNWEVFISKCVEIQHLQLKVETVAQEVWTPEQGKLEEAREEDRLDCDVSGGVGICESSIGGK